MAHTGDGRKCGKHLRLEEVRDAAVHGGGVHCIATRGLGNRGEGIGDFRVIGFVGE